LRREHRLRHAIMIFVSRNHSAAARSRTPASAQWQPVL
jgi:hypothetical protein